MQPEEGTPHHNRGVRAIASVSRAGRQPDISLNHRILMLYNLTLETVSLISHFAEEKAPGDLNR